MANWREYKSNGKEEKQFDAKFMRQETGQGETRRTHLVQRKEFRKGEKINYEAIKRTETKS